MVSRVVNIAAGVLAGLAFGLLGLHPAEAQRRSVGIDVDQNGRAVAVRNIVQPQNAELCFKDAITVRILGIDQERQGLVALFRYQRDRDPQGYYMNVEVDELPISMAERRRVDSRLREILTPGNRVRLNYVGCGVSGRMLHLDAATLVSGPGRAPARAEPAPSAAPPAVAVAPAPARPAAPFAPQAAASDNDVLRSAPWAGGAGLEPGAAAPASSASVPVSPGRSIDAPTPAAPADQPQSGATQNIASPRQATPWRRDAMSNTLSVRATDRRTWLSLDCSKSPRGTLDYRVHIASNFRNWELIEPPGQLLLDGARYRVVFGGADNLVTMANAEGDTVLSRDLLARMLNASVITLVGKDRRKRDSAKLFHPERGAEALEWFDARCATILRRR